MGWFRSPGEPRGLILAGGALSIAGVLTTIIAPSLSAALAETSGLTNAETGLVLTVLHSVQVVVIFSLAALDVVDRVDRRWMGILGCGASALAFLAAGATSGLPPLLAVMAVVGAGAGVAYAAGGSALSFAARTERAYAMVTIASIVVGSLLLALTPAATQLSTRYGVFAGIAATLLVLGLAGTAMPHLQGQSRDRRGTVAAPGPAPRAWIDRPGYVLVAAYFMLNAGLLAVWTFAGQIGEAAGMTSTGSSLFLGASQLLSVAGCLIAWSLGSNTAKIPVLVAALAILAVGKLMVGTAVLWAFVVGMLSTNLTFYTVIPFAFAAGADLNPRSGRLVVVVGASAIVAGAVAPAVGGVVAGPGDNWLLLGTSAAVMIAACIPLMWYSVSVANARKLHAEQEPAPAAPQAP